MLQGYVVVDNVFGSELTRQLQQELLQLHSSGRMHLNCTHLVRGNTTQLLEKSSIYEAELTLDAAVQQAAPLFAKLQQDGTLQTMLNLFLPQLSLDSHAIKLQYNAGNKHCLNHLSSHSSCSSSHKYLGTLAHMPMHAGYL